MSLFRPERPVTPERRSPPPQYVDTSNLDAALQRRSKKEGVAKELYDARSDREKLLDALRTGTKEEVYDPYATKLEEQRRMKKADDPYGFAETMRQQRATREEQARAKTAELTAPLPEATPRIARQAGRMAEAMKERIAGEQLRAKDQAVERRLDIGLKTQALRQQEAREELAALMSAPSGPRREPVRIGAEPAVAERSPEPTKPKNPRREMSFEDQDFDLLGDADEEEAPAGAEVDQDLITTEETAPLLARPEIGRKPKGLRRAEILNNAEEREGLNERADKLEQLAEEMRQANDWSPAEQEEALSIMDEFLARVEANKKKFAAERL